MATFGLTAFLWAFIDSSRHTLTSLWGMQVPWLVLWGIIFFGYAWLKVRAK